MSTNRVGLSPEQLSKLREQGREWDRRRREKARRGEIASQMCRVCQTTPVSGVGLRCKPCYLTQERALTKPNAPRTEPARTTIEVLVHDANFLRSKNVARRDRDPDKYMEVAQDEYWALPSQCQSCRKRIIWAGECYSCATGRARRLLRASERTEVLV